LPWQSKEKKLKISSFNKTPKSLSLDIWREKSSRVSVYQVRSNKSPWIKIGPASWGH
jgi:hypothetical protein